MRPLVTSPEKFAAEFNALVPGAHRRITGDDVRDMTDCGLIGRYDFYGRSDVETVRAILEYERLRQSRFEKAETKAAADVPRCRACGRPLPPEPEGKRGRPKAYCLQCQPYRSRDRWRRHRKGKRKQVARQR